jgi:hypothetical protein
MAMDSRRKRRFISRCCSLPFLCLIPAGALFGQEAQSTAVPNIEILKLHWEKQVRLPRNFDPSVIPANGSFVDPASRSSAAAPTSALDATRVATQARTAAAEANDEFPATPRRLPIFYNYSMKIRNLGLKVIDGIAWDYLFIDPRNRAEVSRHQFVSYAKIARNKTVTLQSDLRSPPTRIVRASDSGKDTHPKLVEQAVIQCILYGDGSVWKSPRARDGLCDLLKNNKPANKQKRT